MLPMLLWLFEEMIPELAACSVVLFCFYLFLIDIPRLRMTNDSILLIIISIILVAFHKEGKKGVTKPSS